MLRLQSYSRQQSGDWFQDRTGGRQWGGSELRALLMAKMLLLLPGSVHSQREISIEFDRLHIWFLYSKLWGLLIHHMALNNQITTNKAEKLY